MSAPTKKASALTRIQSLRGMPCMVARDRSLPGATAGALPVTAYAATPARSSGASRRPRCSSDRNEQWWRMRERIVGQWTLISRPQQLSSIASPRRVRS